jgi:hypothetical protein
MGSNPNLGQLKRVADTLEVSLDNLTADINEPGLIK